MVIIAEGVPVIVECGEEQRFKITPEQLEAAITDKTRLVVLNSPSNPGAACPEAKILNLFSNAT